MSDTSVVENIGAVAHRYEYRATRETYVWPAGEAREVPEEIALTITAAHPNKMRLRDRESEETQQTSAPERVSNKPAENVRGELVEPQTGSSALRQAQGEGISPERPHAHRWRRDNVCRCGLRKEDHRPHSHDWRKDDTCRCGLRREEVGRK